MKTINAAEVFHANYHPKIEASKKKKHHKKNICTRNL